MVAGIWSAGLAWSVNPPPKYCTLEPSLDAAHKRTIIFQTASLGLSRKPLDCRLAIVRIVRRRFIRVKSGDFP